MNDVRCHGVPGFGWLSPRRQVTCTVCTLTEMRDRETWRVDDSMIAIA